jgi:CDP-paratose 2-epimerase
MKKVIITGHAGLIGSEAVEHFYNLGWDVHGIDNNSRLVFFGKDGDTRPTLARLHERCPDLVSHDVNITHRQMILDLFKDIRPDAVIHCAAQPSHDLAAKIPFVDFDTNAGGTFNLLEATRRFAPEAAFVHMSTNKVYGDAPNLIEMVEGKTRWEYALGRHDYECDYGWGPDGINEGLSIDQSMHSLFGASKLAGDVCAQEYGRYFKMNVGVFRGGCLTGARHRGAELHGYLSYFFKAAKEQRPYTIFGYKGKQVRDQIHSYDVVRAFEEFIKAPRQGEVYNIGGGYANSVSILETIDRVEQIFGRKFNYTYDEKNRAGDHICYYSDLTKLKSHYPNWKITKGLDDIFDEFARASSDSSGPKYS